jgi:AraC-like DNA-binding protein
MASWISAPPPVTVERPERGIVHRATTGDLFDLLRDQVGPNLAPFATHLWEVRWDRRGGAPRTSRTIPFPSVNLTVEDGTPGEVRHGHPLPAALVHGVVTRTFRITLDGAGWALGVKFRPGGWAAWSGVDAAPLTDRTVAAAPLLAPLGLDAPPADRRLAPPRRRSAGHAPGGLAAAVLAAGGPEERRSVLREHLERHAPEPTADYLRLRALIDRMRDDPTLVRAEQLPELVGWSPRTLQRHFRRTVGVPAKWVLARFRLQEAAVELERDPGVNLAELSARLGWHDQAHFTNEFRRMLGTTPARYAAAARPPGEPDR